MTLSTTIPSTNVKFDTFTLSGGKTLVFIQTPGNPIVSVQAFFPKDGTLTEPPDKAGLTSFALSLITRGTSQANSLQLAEKMESIGASIGASATEDYASASVTVSEKYFSQAWEIFEDVLLHPSFPESEIEKVRPMRLASLRAQEESIFSIAYQKSKKKLFGSHPYGRNVNGSTETVTQISRDDIVHRYSEIMLLHEATWVAVGDISSRKIKKSIENILRKQKVKPNPKKESPPPIFSKRNTRDSEKKPFGQAYLMRSYPAPLATDADYTAIKVLNALLGGGMSSRLFQILREEESFAYEVNSFYPSKKQASHFVLYLGLDKSRLEEAEKKLDEILQKIQNETPDEEEVEQARRYVKGTYLMDHQTNVRRAWYMGFWEMTGRGHLFDQIYPQEIEQVTPGDIRRVARKIFSQASVTVTILPSR